MVTKTFDISCSIWVLDLSQQVAVCAASADLCDAAALLAQRWQLPYSDGSDIQRFHYLLVVTAERLELQQTTAQHKPLVVDFLSGAVNYRRLHGGGTKQLIAKAIGLKSGYRPTVLDVTAGLGKDAFVLACLGCNVTMLERSPVVAALLLDGLQRVKQQPEFMDLPLTALHQHSINYLSTLPAQASPDVIYLDPMFPARTKSARVKKELLILRDIVGDDEDAVDLLTLALRRAKKRVVVKRPKLAAALAQRQPDYVYRGESSRFDVYVPEQ